MFSKYHWVVVVLTFVLCASCGSDRSPQLSEALQKLLPSMENVDSITQSFPGVVKDWPPQLDSDGGRKFALSRPGDVGYRGYRIEEMGSSVNGVLIELLLYAMEDERDAERFWDEYPPHEAHAHNSSNMDYFEGRPPEDQLDKWRLDSPSSSGLFTWEVICLASSPLTGSPENCLDFSGWVQMCRWVLEIRIGFDGPRWEMLPSQRVATTMEGIADLLAEETGCDR